VIDPIEAKLAAGKELAAPYISAVKESSAPYVAKVSEAKAKLDSFRRSERVEAMVAAFQEARAHPVEKVGELRAKAVDLIKYENIKSYRDHIMSAEFQADTTRLVKVELPAVAAAAAKKGVETVKATATSLAEEIEAVKETAKKVVASGYELANEVEFAKELEALKAKVAQTSAALLAELNDGMSHVKNEGFSLAEVVERLKRVGAVVEAAFHGEPPAVEVTEEAATGDEEKKPPAAPSECSEEETFADAKELDETMAQEEVEAGPTLTEDSVGAMY